MHWREKETRLVGWEMNKRSCFFSCVSSGSYESLTTAMLRQGHLSHCTHVRLRKFTRELFFLCHSCSFVPPWGLLTDEKTVSFYLILLPSYMCFDLTIAWPLLLLHKHVFSYTNEQHVFFFIFFSFNIW